MTAYIALSWWVLQKSGSALQFSMILAPVAAIQIFLPPLIAPLVDRYSRKAIMILCDVLRLFTSLSVFLMMHFDYFNISALVFISCLGAIFTAGFESSVAGLTKFLVSEKDLPSGMQTAQVFSGLKSFVNPAVSGTILGLYGPAMAVLFNIASYGFALLFNSLLELKGPILSKTSLTSKESFALWWKDLHAGFSSLFQAKVIFHALLLSATFQFMFSHLHVTLPVLILKERMLPAWNLGVVESALGIGAMVGAVTLGNGQKMLPGRLLWVVSFILAGASIFLLGFSKSLAIGVVVLFASMIFMSWLNIQFQTKISVAIPAQYVGRIFTFIGVFMSGTLPIGISMAGGLVEKYGASTVIASSGITAILLFPLIFLVPFLNTFLTKPNEELAGFIAEKYPQAFK
ncbi:MFS transporter [Bdellovibrio reynosensis]|uniref:MFS transporter n=1 Tax=Bdellovibrio reynosensis TaxID=2835041 RepID=A0ABY4CGH3_9BACT|nr:MFS transporter [Bdellovibrio reynosensis]